jgi:gliding motility-associated-like protein
MRNTYTPSTYVLNSQSLVRIALLLCVFLSVKSFSQIKIVEVKGKNIPQADLENLFHRKSNFGTDDERRKLVYKIFESWSPQSNDSIAGLNAYDLLTTSYARNILYGEIPHFMAHMKHDHLQHKYNLPEQNEFGRFPHPNEVMAACTNMDFEAGSSAGWTGTNGINSNSQTQAGCCPTAGANTSAMTGAGTDACGGFPVVCPGGGTYSLMLGDGQTRTGRCDRLTQTFQVSPSNCVLTVNYAVVLEDGGHLVNEQPYFNIEVRNQAGALLPCGDFYVAVGSSNATGFVSSGACFGTIYANWRSASFDLSALNGQNVTVTYTVSDCIYTGHFGYCYIDGFCGPCAIQSSNPCSGGAQNICAPPGYASYSWNGPGGFTGNTQCVNVSAQGNYTVTGTQAGGCPIPVLTYSLAPSPQPTASFTAANGICNTIVTFSDASTIGAGGTISTWSWDFGEPASGAANTSSAQNPSHTYLTIGNFVVTLTVTSVSGCTSTFTTTVNSSGGPQANFTYATTGGVPACPGVTIDFTNTSTTPAGTNLTGGGWDFGDPASGASNTSAAQNPSHTYALAGSYVVTYTVSNDAGCSGSITQTVVINANPVPVFSTSPVCLNTCTQFNNTTPAAPAIGTWAWDFTNDGTNDDATQAPCFTFPAAGTYTTLLTATTTAGCVGTYTATSMVNPNPTASFTVSTECEGVATQFDGSPSTVPAPDNIAFYNWTFGDGNNASGQTTTHTYANCGTYTANLVVVSNNSCTNNTNVTVTVKCRPTVTVPTNSVVCPGDAIAATAFTSNPAGAAYDWTNSETAINLGALGTGDIPGFNTTNTGSTQLDAAITVTPTLAGCVGTPGTYTISVKPTPIMDPVSDATYCPNDAVAPAVFTTNPPGSSYNWTNSDPTIGLAANGAGPYAGFAAVNGGTTTLVSTITVTPTLASCVGPPLSYSITVNPTPVAAVPASALYCSFDIVPATGFTSVPANATFSWTNSDATIGLAASGTGQIAAFSTANIDPFQHDATIAVTPTLAGCVGLPVTYTISVKPTPFISAIPDVLECPGVNVPAVNITTTPAGANISWVHSNANVGLATTSGTTTVPAFTTTNAVSNDEISIVTISTDMNGCVGADSTYIITVRPTPVLLPITSYSYCPNVTTVPPAGFSTVPSGATINWTNTNTSIGLASLGVDDYSTFVPTNITSTNQVATITATPTLNTCVGLPETYSITVYPKPIAVVPANSEACPADPITGFVFNSIPADVNTHYSWTHTNGTTGLSQGVGTAANTSSTNNFTASNLNATLITTNFTLITELNGCFSDPKNFSFTVNPLPSPSFGWSHTCEGDATNFSSLSTVGSGSIVTWQWDFDNNGSYELSGGNAAPSQAIAGAGVHTIHLNVITDKSCFKDVTQTMYVNPNPVPSVGVDDPDGCPDHSVKMGASVAPGSVDHANSIVSWAWDVNTDGTIDSLNLFPGGSQIDSLYYTYTNTSPVASQYYQVTLTVTSDSGCVGTHVTSPSFITVFAHPVADFAYGPEEPELTVQTPLVSFYDQSQGATHWEWSFSDPYTSIGANSSNLQDPQHYYENYNDSTYMVQLYIDNGQCSDSITKPVVIRPEWTFYIPSAFSPNGDGVNDGFKGTGVNIDKDSYSLMIFDRWGAQIWTSRDLEQEWDGKVSGKTKQVQEDVFVWKVKFKDGKNTRHEFEGTVTVIR